MCVTKHWEYQSNPTPYYTHRRCMVTVSHSLQHMSWRILVTCLTFTDTCFKVFHCKAQLFVQGTFHIYKELLCSMGHELRGAICLYYKSPTYSFHGKHDVHKSRICVLFLGGIQLVRLLVIIIIIIIIIFIYCNWVVTRWQWLFYM